MNSSVSVYFSNFRLLCVILRIQQFELEHCLFMAFHEIIDVYGAPKTTSFSYFLAIYMYTTCTPSYKLSLVDFFFTLVHFHSQNPRFSSFPSKNSGKIRKKSTFVEITSQKWYKEKEKLLPFRRGCNSQKKKLHLSPSQYGLFIIIIILLCCSHFFAPIPSFLFLLFFVILK